MHPQQNFSDAFRMSLYSQVDAFGSMWAIGENLLKTLNKFWAIPQQCFEMSFSSTIKQVIVVKYYRLLPAHLTKILQNPSSLFICSNILKHSYLPMFCFWVTAKWKRRFKVWPNQSTFSWTIKSSIKTKYYKGKICLFVICINVVIVLRNAV